MTYPPTDDERLLAAEARRALQRLKRIAEEVEVLYAAGRMHRASRDRLVALTREEQG